TRSAGVRMNQPNQHAKRGRFAGAVRPEQPEDLAFFDGQVQPVYREDVFSESLRESLDLDRSRHRRESSDDAGDQRERRSQAARGFEDVQRGIWVLPGGPSGACAPADSPSDMVPGAARSNYFWGSSSI